MNNTPIDNLWLAFKHFTAWLAFLMAAGLYAIAFMLLFQGSFGFGIFAIAFGWGCMIYSRELAKTLLQEARLQKFKGDDGENN